MFYIKQSSLEGEGGGLLKVLGDLLGASLKSPFVQVSQYQCSSCGSILKETAEYIDIHSLKEECPQCGSMLADTLQSQAIKPRLDFPHFQTADTLLKFRFDVPKIDSFLGLASTDLCCITGYNANQLLTRVSVRALLPTRYGGLNSPYTLVADAGNRSDVYGTINFARQYGLNKEEAAERILVVRAYTVPQVWRLLSKDLPLLVDEYQINCVTIPGLLNTIDEETSLRVKEAKRQIGKIMKKLDEISRKILVITSIQEGKYTKWVLPEFTKRIILNTPKRGRADAELYNQGITKTVSLTTRDLRIVPSRYYGMFG